MSLVKCGGVTSNNWNGVVLLLLPKNGDKIICSNDKGIILIYVMIALPSSSSNNFGQGGTVATHGIRE